MHDLFAKPVAAIVQQVEETEEQLIARCRDRISRTAWAVGKDAAKWKAEFANGRTDTDFADMVGMSREQVTQRRLVYERFHDHPVATGQWNTCYNLTFSHFREAVNWDDADSCLKWASDMKATVAEMKAWRRLSQGDDDGEYDEDDLESGEEDEGNGDDRAPADENRNGSSNLPSRVSAESQGADSESSKLPAPSAPSPEPEPQEFNASTAIMSIREVCRRAEQEIEPDSLEELSDELKSWERRLRPKVKFSPPPVADVMAYCQERGNNVDPQAFVDFYTSKGWLVGKVKMRDWRAAVRTWEKNRRGDVKPKLDSRTEQEYQDFLRAHEDDG